MRTTNGDIGRAAERLIKVSFPLKRTDVEDAVTL